MPGETPFSKQPAPSQVCPSRPSRPRPLTRPQSHRHRPSNESRIPIRQMTTPYVPARLHAAATHPTPRSHIRQNARATATAYPGSQDTLVPPVIPSFHPSRVCKNTVVQKTSMKHAVSQSNMISSNPLLVSCHLTIMITSFASLYDWLGLFHTRLQYIHFSYCVPRAARVEGGILSLVHYPILVHLNYTILIHYFSRFPRRSTLKHLAGHSVCTQCNPTSTVTAHGHWQAPYCATHPHPWHGNVAIRTVFCCGTSSELDVRRRASLFFVLPPTASTGLAQGGPPT